MRRKRRDWDAILTRRRRVLLAGWLLSGGLIVARATQVQVAQRATWRLQAQQQQRTSEELPAPRGTVVDRGGFELASSREVFRVSVAPREIGDREEVTRLLIGTLGLDETVVREATNPSKAWRVLPGTHPPSVRDALINVRGIYPESEYSRFYPHGELGAGLLGVVRDGKAHGGIEQWFNGSLRGTVGRAVLQRDAAGREIPGEKFLSIEPRKGGRVILTLDVDLQEIGSEALARSVRETGARGGDLVITDPRTGDILAMVSIRDGSMNALSAINTPYEPGSTLKPLTVAGLLQHGLATLSDSVDTGSGSWTVNGRTISDVHPEGGVMTVSHALEISSNVGVAKAAQVMEPAIQYQNLRDFGLGVQTGVELPGEGSGTLRRPEDWSKQSAVSLAIGYEVSVTPIQMAMAYGVFANGGQLMAPRLVKEIQDSEGQILHRFQSRRVRQVVSPRVTRQISDVLVNAVEDGTGTRARLSTFAVAGKSGTSRAWSNGGYQDGEYFSSFVGFFPAVDPQLLVLVKLDRPKGAYYGGATAAPVTRATMEAILASQRTVLDRRALARVARSQELDEPVTSRPQGEALSPSFAALDGGGMTLNNSPVRVPWSPEEDIVEVTVPDVRGLSARAAVRRMHELGFRVRSDGSGLVTDLVPDAGSTVILGDTVYLISMSPERDE